MGIHDHDPRHVVVNRNQHLYRHTLDEFNYSHSAITGTTLKAAMDWIVAVLYPRTQPSVANVAALPAAGNALLDYRVVLDDGDGKAASYRWEKREGESVASWHKIYDMDWGEGSILSGFLDKTQDVYLYRYGYDDRDAAGAAVTGVLAGQSFFGGASPSTNMTLFANSGDGTGASTGYVQFGDNVRPITDGAYALGQTGKRFTTGWFATLVAGTLTLAAGSVVDSSGALSFGATNLTTTGTLAAGAVTGTSFIVGDTTWTAGSVNRSSGTSYSFNALNVLTTGYVQATSFRAGTLTVADGSISDSDGTISFGSTILSTSGALSAGAISGASLAIDNLFLDLNTISTTNTNGDLVLAPNGTGKVSFTKDISALGAGVVTGSWTAGNLKLLTNTLSSIDTNGNVIVSPNGTGWLSVTSKVLPSTDAARDLGSTTARFQNLYLSGAIGDGTTTIAQSVLQSLRDINVGVGTNYTIFWNGSKWVSSAPDTEIDHTALSNLTTGDAGHTQFAMLAGRTGGQTLYGDTAISGNLTLSPTANATKGVIIWEGVLRPTSDGLLDIGTASKRIQNLYIGGQAVGMRLENATTAGRPAASASTKGRLVFDTDLGDCFVDRGGTWFRMSLEKYVNQDASGWTGSVTSVAYTVSADISDARLAHWALYDNSNSFVEVQATITKTQTVVTVAVTSALPAGTYTLIGVG